LPKPRRPRGGGGLYPHHAAHVEAVRSGRVRRMAGIAVILLVLAAVCASLVNGTFACLLTDLFPTRALVARVLRENTDDLGQSLDGLKPKLEPNLATGKPVTASSGTQMPQKPEFAVDGKIDEPHDSWWAGPPPQWLQVDLGSACATDRIQVFPFWDGSRCYQYIVEASLDGKTWKLLGDKRANTTPATPQGDEFTFPVENTRYVRVTMLKNSANEGVHLVELMVHAPKKG
jgi:hypothetical protein